MIYNKLKNNCQASDSLMAKGNFQIALQNPTLRENFFVIKNGIHKQYRDNKEALFRLGGNPDLLPTMNFDHFL